MLLPPSIAPTVEVVVVYWRSGGPVLGVLAGVCVLQMLAVLRGHRAGWVAVHTAPPRTTATAESEHCRSLRELLRRERTTLGVLTAAAPLLGLFGTVTGMVATFRGVAFDTSHMTPAIADGIGRALVTTQAGLTVAIPGLLAQAWLRRLDRVAEGRLALLRLAERSLP